MFERLLFPSLVEQEACRQLLRDNWPSITIVDIGTSDELALEIHLNVDEAVFFRWAYVYSRGRHNGVLAYCYRFSVMLLGDDQDKPTWMKTVLLELYQQRLLPGDTDV